MGFRRPHFFSGRMTSRAQRAPRGQLASLGGGRAGAEGTTWAGRAALRRAVLWASPGEAGRTLCRGRHPPRSDKRPPRRAACSQSLVPRACRATGLLRQGPWAPGRSASAERAAGRSEKHERPPPEFPPRVLSRPVVVVFASKPQHRVAGCALVLRHARKPSPRERESLGSRSLAPIALA